MEPNSEYSSLFRHVPTPILSQRPHRTEPISQDDLLNLRIALELSKDVREFLEDQHIFES